MAASELDLHYSHIFPIQIPDLNRIILKADSIRISFENCEHQLKTKYILILY